MSSAYFLAEAGYDVTVVEKGTIGGACSRGNCGLVCPSHVLPLAEPGALRDAFRALLNPGGAFRIRPRLDLNLWRWLWNFARRCTHQRMLESGRAIQPLLASSLSLYQQLVRDQSLECEWQKQGLLFVYRNAHALDAYQPAADLLAEEFDEKPEKLVGDRLLEREPALSSGLAGAWYFEHDAQYGLFLDACGNCGQMTLVRNGTYLRPDRLLASWRGLLEQRGVRIIENAVLESLDASSGRVRAAVASGQRLEADHFVVATGAWTPQLAQVLGVRIPIEPGKGYSFTTPVSPNGPRTPMIFPETHVAVTPMDTGLRIGSMMEFSGYDESLRVDRLRMLADGAAPFLRDPLPGPQSEQWFGWRPMTWDSTPVIGPCPGLENVYLAVGHNMLGISMAPATGRLLAELVSGAEPPLDPSPYQAERLLN